VEREAGVAGAQQVAEERVALVLLVWWRVLVRFWGEVYGVEEEEKVSGACADEGEGGKRSSAK